MQQQTATADILGVISNSLDDTQPVFDAIVQSGLKLFPSAAVLITLRDGDRVKAAAVACPDASRGDDPAQVSGSAYDEYLNSTAILDARDEDLLVCREPPAALAVGARNFLEVATGPRRSCR